MKEDPALAPETADIRPIVASRPSNRGVWIFGAAALAGASLLFYTLESRRETMVVPSLARTSDYEAGFIAPPPDLDISSDYAGGLSLYPRRDDRFGSGAPASVQPLSPDRSLEPQRNGVRPSTEAASRGSQTYVPETYPPPPQQPIEAPRLPRLEPPEPPAPPNEGEGLSRGKDRVEATRFSNPGTTVSKGTVIQAVLETALDSTKAGFARAVISRDVYSFDGSRVLIPRGSRIIGEYKADVALGQKRVLIQWQRLMRPDGIMIDMDSPSADPLGRAGIKGKVNSHFFQRFAGAILQSGLDIGTQLATRRVSNDTIIIGLPAVTQGLNVVPDKIPPTVKVRQGSSVSVFVARDLDFTKVS